MESMAPNNAASTRATEVPRLRRQTVANPPMGRDERRAAGKALRQRAPHESHAGWSPAAARLDPVAQVIKADQGRIANLVPLRHSRMMASPLTFYRGAADVMAADLADTPVSGIRSQICGDCHLLNMGSFATPERRVVFDINDFDETLPGPWEWDVKRLAASFVLASRCNGFGRADQREVTLSCVRSYRERMAEFATMSPLEVWYARVDMSAALKRFHDPQSVARAHKQQARAASTAASEHHFPATAVRRDGRAVIEDAPPLISHDAHSGLGEGLKNVEDTFAAYRLSLVDDRRVLLDRYRLQDVAQKVVGIGSVGTLCAVILLTAEGKDPLFLQLKEARPSVLERHLPKSAYRNRGQRVVEGQRLMQAASDIFLGWTLGHGQKQRHFYLRQLRDMKIKPLVEMFGSSTMSDYGCVCGWALARAHARGGDATMISGYLGKRDTFDEAIARFGVDYADQSERDHAAFVDAIRAGRIEAAH